MSIDIFVETNVELMDGIKDTSIYSKIINAVEAVDGASNPHRIRTRQLGKLYIISLDIEVDGQVPLYEAHAIANSVEESIKKVVENVYDIVVHIEPKGVGHNEEKFGIDKKTLV